MRAGAASSSAFSASGRAAWAAATLACSRLRGDGGGRVLGDGGDDDRQGEADGVVEVEGLVVVED